MVVHGTYAVMGGGAEPYSIRIVSLLQRQFHRIVVLHHGEPPDLDEIERSSGFDLDRGKVEFCAVPPPRRLGGLLKPRSGLALLRYAFIVREAQRQARDFDLVASTFCECSVGEVPAM